MPDDNISLVDLLSSFSRVERENSDRIRKQNELRERQAQRDWELGLNRYPDPRLFHTSIGISSLAEVPDLSDAIQMLGRTESENGTSEVPNASAKLKKCIHYLKKTYEVAKLYNVITEEEKRKIEKLIGTVP